MTQPIENWPLDFPSDKHILFCCLNWGLGHATRSIPIIQALIEHGNKVTIASDGIALKVLTDQFPSLPILELQSYNVTYPFNSIVINMLFQSPKLSFAIHNEHRKIKNFCIVHNIDCIISDNRLGCYHPSIYSIIITHQLEPFHHNRFLSYIGRTMTANYVKKFNSLWIPDDEKILLSGKLSKYEKNYPAKHFLGLKSRMTNSGLEGKDIVVLLSGPEPQRTILEKTIYQILKNETKWHIHFIRGSNIPNEKHPSLSHMIVYDVVNAELLQEILDQSTIVIARSGYTTLIDMELLNKKAIFIPTPGQTEQEYLAEYHCQKWPYIPQEKIEEKLLPAIHKEYSK